MRIWFNESVMAEMDDQLHWSCESIPVIAVALNAFVNFVEYGPQDGEPRTVVFHTIADMVTPERFEFEEIIVSEIPEGAQA